MEKKGNGLIIIGVILWIAEMAIASDGVFARYEVIKDGVSIRQAMTAFKIPSPYILSVSFEIGDSNSMEYLRRWNNWSTEMDWDSLLSRGVDIQLPHPFKLLTEGILRPVGLTPGEFDKLTSQPAKQPGEP